MKSGEREKIIYELIENWHDNVQSDPAILDTVLKSGFKGYHNFTNSELKKEHAAFFGDKNS